MRYDALIFDNDGVLTTLTDRSVLRSAIVSTFEEFDVTNPPEEHCEALLAVTVADLRATCRPHGLDEEAFWFARDANAAAAQCAEIDAGRKTLYDDVEALELLASDVKLGVVSNNQQETVEYILDHFDLDGLFETCYGREPTVDGIRRKKPRPYYLERALADLGTDEALYVGDSTSDVLAAERAGIDSAFIRRPHRSAYQLEFEPTYELESLHELSALVTSESAIDADHSISSEADNSSPTKTGSSSPTKTGNSSPTKTGNSCPSEIGR